MKILHALVTYLAVTTLPAPFHSFSFASPLAAAIDYDGYVNTTQNHIDGALTKHVLDNIMETCQTVTYHSGYMNTTQNYSDSALMKRSGDIIKARQAPFLAPVVIGVVFAIVAAVSLSIIWVTDHDHERRAAFTQGTVSKTFSQYPKYNWVICHSSYSIGFDGVEGTDWGYTHHELKISLGRTVGYDLYWARSGTFYRYGDGGFINWAYTGKILGTDDGGATVHFGTIS